MTAEDKREGFETYKVRARQQITPSKNLQLEDKNIITVLKVCLQVEVLRCRRLKSKIMEPTVQYVYY